MKIKTIINKLLSLSLAVTLTSICFTGCGKSDEANSDSAGTASTVSNAGDAASSVVGSSGTEESDSMFPYQLEDGKLAVNSFFTSDIDNPDCGNITAESIASIEVLNQSEECLLNGTFTVTTEDGTNIPFVITYLPAGEKAWLFATDNTTVTDAACASIADTAEFNSEDLLMTGSFEVIADGTTVTLTNNSGADQSHILVYCHSKMEDTIYGGITYTYSVDYMPAGETATIDAADCFLGTAEAERVSVGEY